MIKYTIEEIVESNDKIKHLNTIALKFKDEVLKGKINKEELEKEVELKELERKITSFRSDLEEIEKMDVTAFFKIQMVKDRMKFYNFKNKELLNLLNRFAKRKKLNVNYFDEIFELAYIDFNN